MASWVKQLPCKCEDHNLDPLPPSKSWAGMEASSVISEFLPVLTVLTASPKEAAQVRGSPSGGHEPLWVAYQIFTL